jgi:hypothetical protein
MPNNCCINFIVIASAAKQSRGYITGPLGCIVASLSAMTLLRQQQWEEIG